MSDEVTNFLRSVEQLKDRRLEEDEARSRELEEKILQEKRERQARRAERARSISPQKSSPANTPPPTSHRHNNSQLSDGLKLTSSPALDSPGSPQSRAQRHTDTMGSADLSTSPTKENDAPFDIDNKRSGVTSPSSGVPARTPTLSWQRRPPSQASDRPKSRPLSMVAAENAAARSSTSLPDQNEPTASRDQIAQALSSKDPSWFRQTADRGQNSAAYRRTQVEDEDRLDMSSMRSQLPGMSNASPTEPERHDSFAAHSNLGSPLPLTPAQRFDPPVSDLDSAPRDRQNPMSPPSGRISPTRPVSPTKGMGGFVQSAMMKRTDSVKRWSVTSPTGLQRADSVASRPSMENVHRTSISQQSPSSRPTSSHGKDTTAAATAGSDVTRAEPPEEPKYDEADRTTPPSSPSKTMDPRRWSPTKSSSWLEAALNKPESPKPKPTPPPSNQPAWMVELNKAKANKGTTGGDLDRSSSVARKHEVKTGGLMRSSPMGTTAKPSGSGLGAAATYHSPSTSISGDKSIGSGLRSNLSRTTSAEQPESGGETLPKVKPETPPKKDFRTNLKPRQPVPGGSKDEGNDFKNVFGNLRKTTTKNYVAPDTFKDNITRGKNALNLTGGPKPREKKDELKDAILQKKAEFKQAKAEGRGIATNAHTPVDKAVPEGLVKRMEMSRSNTVSSKRDSTASDAPSEASRTYESNRTSVLSTASRRDSADTIATPIEKEAPAPMPTLHKERSAPARLQKPAGGGLADRFNPALAGMLARGPPPMASGPSRDAESNAREEPSAPGPQLSHMTKNRARGPKRKAPSTAVKTTESQAAQLVDTEASLPKPQTMSPRMADPEPRVISLADSAKPASTPDAVISLVDSSRKRSMHQPTKSNGSAISLVDSPATGSRPRSPTKIHEQVAAIAARGQQTPAKTQEDKSEEPISQPSSPRKLDMKRMSRFMDESGQPTTGDIPRPLSPSKTGGRAQPEPRPLSPQKTGGRPLPESPRKEAPSDKVDSDPLVSMRNGAAMFGSAAAAAASKPFSIAPVPALESRRPRSPTKSSGQISPPLASPQRSPTKYASEVSSMLNEFFGNERPERNYRVDAGEILMRRPTAAPKVRTDKAQLFRISGDGKKQSVPAHHERVLFEREMYFCPHTFTNESGKKISEVYFWAGDEVPEATIEDAQVFVNKEARSFGGKVVKLRQGKETGEFIQALGGIIIIRRGGSNKYDSLAPNMLCGRRYMGQIAFDEVDFSPKSLCSGFPYLVTQSGKCNLWKGKGSDVDELSCARLIGMDLALMGELVEVDDGNEPAGFWNMFNGGSKTGSADHWRLKPNYDKYSGRLFCSEASNRQQITEIHPFSQEDLSPGSIYVLDAFFEMYIIVGQYAYSQYASFHNALDFAQEYAILASSMEDRPFVPISTVVLEGIPRDLKSVFRKWRDNASPTRMNENNPTSPNLKRGRSLRIVPLTQALQALTE